MDFNPSDFEDEQPLGPVQYLSARAGFSGKVTAALDHPSRREILRGLQEQKVRDEGSTAAELCAHSGVDALSSLNFHLAVLEGAELIRRGGWVVPPGEPRFRQAAYLSNVAGDTQMFLLLLATELIDGRRAC